MKRILVAVALTVVLGLGACGSDGGSGNVTPAQLCSRLGPVLCEKIIDCVDPAQWPPGVTDQASCEASYEQQVDCATATETDYCTAPEVYQPQNVDACLSAAAAQSCADFNNDVTPPGCDVICQ